MRATARVYWRLLAADFRRQSAYRLAALCGLVANLTFGLLKVAVLSATVRAAGGQLHGYDTASWRNRTSKPSFGGSTPRAADARTTGRAGTRRHT